MTEPSAGTTAGIARPESSVADVLTAASAEVNQAGGMLMVQLACEIAEALDYLQVQAELHHRPVPDLARAVVDGTASSDTLS